MELHPNKSPIEVIKEGVFGGTYFRDVCSNTNDEWYKSIWKESDDLKNIEPKYYSSNFYDTKVNKYRVKCGTSLRSWENKGWISSIDLYGWLQWYFRYYLGRRSSDDEKQIKRWKDIVARFKGILIKMIKNEGAKFDDYSISPKIRQILLHWWYELVESDLF